MSGDTADRLITPSGDPTPRASWPSRALDWGEVRSHRLLSHLRPRVSLASGSILVLLTLFLPIGYEACGPAHMGHSLVRGEGDWPSYLGLVSSTGGQIFYIVCLAVASLTVFFVVLSTLKPSVARYKLLTVGLSRLAGTVSLFLILDLYFLLVGLAEGWANAVVYSLVAVSCLSPGLYWPRRVFLAWLSFLAIATSLLFILDASGMVSASLFEWVLLSFEVAVAAVLLGIWHGFRYSRVAERRAQWQTMRSGLVAFYVPAVVGSAWLLFLAVEERVWGLIPCYFGIHLMAIGYLLLTKEVETAPPLGTPGGP